MAARDLPTSVYRYTTRTGEAKCRVIVKAMCRCVTGGTYPLTREGIEQARIKAERLRALQKGRL